MTLINTSKVNTAKMSSDSQWRYVKHLLLMAQMKLAVAEIKLYIAEIELHQCAEILESIPRVKL